MGKIKPLQPPKTDTRAQSTNENTPKPHILCLGEKGFPVGFGAIQRMMLIAKGLIVNGCEATVVSFKGVHGPSQDFPPVGTYEGINYIYTSDSIHRPSGFLNRNWAKVRGKLKELAWIRKQKKLNRIQGVLVSTADLDMLFIYWLWFKILRIPFALNYDELSSAIASRTKFLERLNDKLFDKYAVKLTDGVTPISEYLTKHTREISPKKPMQKLPILCDFDKFDLDVEQDDEIRFVYCGAASYMQLIHFVLNAFDKLEIGEREVYLDFILGGNKGSLEKVKAEIAKCKNNAHIRLNANVPHQEIPLHYAKASALLIPLRPTIQDAARFPHKLGEYLASGSPVITTAYGEINHYDFIDGETALVADEYEETAFFEKMKFVMENPEIAAEIGQKGKEMGFLYFDYQKIGKDVKNFLLSLK